MNHTEIVKKLIGPTLPIGESNEDANRYTNLVNLCLLAENLFFEIQKVSAQKAEQYSIQRSATFATSFLETIKESLTEE